MIWTAFFRCLGTATITSILNMLAPLPCAQSGFDIDEMTRSGYVWPVIESHCRYIAPLRYGMRSWSGRCLTTVTIG